MRLADAQARPRKEVVDSQYLDPGVTSL